MASQSSSRARFASQRSMTLVAHQVSEIMPHLVEINRPETAPGLVLSSLWIIMVSAMLIVFVWQFEHEESKRMEDVAFEVAAFWAAALAAEALAPALDVARTVEAALESGAAASLADYGPLARALAPHFEATPGLLEVQYSEALADGGKSVLALKAAALSVAVERGALPSLSVRSDRGDCDAVRGGLGCASEPLAANGTGWYSRGFSSESMHTTAPLGFWEGPSFTRVDLDEVVCTSLCWSPSVSFVARPTGQPGLLRTVVDAGLLRPVVDRVQERLSGGDALLCNSAGEVVASSDMAELLLFGEKGSVRPAKVWELTGRSWATEIPQDELADMISEPEEDLEPVGVGSYRVIAHKLFVAANVTNGLDEHLRVVLALPNGAFSDIEQWNIPTAIISAFPPAVLTSAIVLVFLKVCCSTNINRVRKTAMTLYAGLKS